MDPESALVPINSDHLLPIPALRPEFISSLDTLSPTALDNALLSYALVYSASHGKICLREDQLLAGVHAHEGRHTVKVARTGSGKTMQIVIAALMNPGCMILVLSPLKRLQNSMADIISRIIVTICAANMAPLLQASELNELGGIKAVAVNQELRNNLEVWADIYAGVVYNVILTSPEQCRRINGHPTRLSVLLQKNRKFVARISTVAVDEAHLIYLWGLTLAGNKIAFRPAWGKLWDLRLLLNPSTPFILLSATNPPHILDMQMKSLSLHDPFISKSSINRSNQVYATYPIFGSLKEFQNLRMVIRHDLLVSGAAGTRTLSLDEYISLTPKTVIFVDDKTLLAAGPSALYALVPLSLRTALCKQGYIRYYHSGMSSRYLDQTYDSFLGNKSPCRILFASSAFAHGINVSDIQYVIQYGLCEFLEDMLQRFGRNARRGDIQGLSLLMVDPWAAKPSAKPTAREHRTTDAMKHFATSPTCLRKYIAEYSHDDSSEALDFTGPHCCDKDGDSMQELTLQDYFPSPLLLAKPPVIRPRVEQVEQRPIWQQGHMSTMLNTWLDSASRKEKTPAGVPDYFVLSDGLITRMVCLPYSIFTSVDNLRAAIHKRQEWADLFGEDLLAEIVEFEHQANIHCVQWTKEYEEYERQVRSKKRKQRGHVSAGSEEKNRVNEANTRDDGGEGPQPRKRIQLTPRLTLLV